MGIKGLSKLIQQNTDGTCIKSSEIKSYFGREIAIDASMALYQFLIAVRMQSGSDGGFQQLMNDSGEVTSHLIGILYRTIRMREHGIKPVYVFDGKPPDFKSHELEKRKANREKAQQELKEAEKADDKEKVAQMQRRLVKVDKTHVAEAQRLLDCLGVPWIAAPGEAEAQCAILVKEGLVYGSATEDMDALTFGTPRLLRNLTYSEARKLPVLEFDLEKVLKGLDVTMDQFIDICILLGCDYIPSIRGIGPAKALTFIKEHGNIEGLIEAIKSEKIGGNYVIPDGFLYKEARELFKKPDVTENKENLLSNLKWKDCDEEALIEFLVNEKHFNMDRVQSAIKRLKKCKGKSSQRRVDAFFSFKGTTTSTSKVNKMKQLQSEKSNKKGKKNSKFNKSNKKTNKNNEKAGPYAHVNYNDKTKTKTKTSTTKDHNNNSDNSSSNNSNDSNGDNSINKSVKKNVKSTKKTKKSTKKRKTTAKKTKKSTKKTKKSVKKITGVKRKRMEIDEDDTKNSGNNSNSNSNSNELPDIGNVCLDSKEKSNNSNSNNNNDNEDESESIELAGFDDIVDDGIDIDKIDDSNNNNINNNNNEEVESSEPPRKRQRLMTSSEIEKDKINNNIVVEEKEKEIVYDNVNDIVMDKNDDKNDNEMESKVLDTVNDDKVNEMNEDNDVKSAEHDDDIDNNVKDENDLSIQKNDIEQKEDIDVEMEKKENNQIEKNIDDTIKKVVNNTENGNKDDKINEMDQENDEINKENNQNSNAQLVV